MHLFVQIDKKVTFVASKLLNQSQHLGKSNKQFQIMILKDVRILPK